jgi:hypothetical protein
MTLIFNFLNLGVDHGKIISSLDSEKRTQVAGAHDQSFAHMSINRSVQTEHLLFVTFCLLLPTCPSLLSSTLLRANRARTTSFPTTRSRFLVSRFHSKKKGRQFLSNGTRCLHHNHAYSSSYTFISFIHQLYSRPCT